MKNNILLLFAHPSQSRSEVNKPLLDAALTTSGVTVVDLYAEYPTYNIDIEKEQSRLLEHEVIIFQFPLFWYSTPAILKEWQDLVLEYGFAYGHDGKALHGKRFFCSLSAGGQAHAYQSDGSNHFTIEELLRPIEQMANLTGLIYLPPFCLFGARTAVEEHSLDSHLEQWKQLLLSLQVNPGAMDGAKGKEQMNTFIKLQSETIEDDEV